MLSGVLNIQLQGTDSILHYVLDSGGTIGHVYYLNTVALVKK